MSINIHYFDWPTPKMTDRTNIVSTPISRNSATKVSKKSSVKTSSGETEQVREYNSAPKNSFGKKDRRVREDKPSADAEGFVTVGRDRSSDTPILADGMSPWKTKLSYADYVVCIGEFNFRYFSGKASFSEVVYTLFKWLEILSKTDERYASIPGWNKFQEFEKWFNRNHRSDMDERIHYFRAPGQNLEFVEKRGRVPLYDADIPYLLWLLSDRLGWYNDYVCNNYGADATACEFLSELNGFVETFDYRFALRVCLHLSQGKRDSERMYAIRHPYVNYKRDPRSASTKTEKTAEAVEVTEAVEVMEPIDIDALMGITVKRCPVGPIFEDDDEYRYRSIHEAKLTGDDLDSSMSALDGSALSASAPCSRTKTSSRASSLSASAPPM